MNRATGSLLFRAYNDQGEPAEVTRELGLEPMHTQVAGEPSHFPELGPIPASGWFYEIEIPADVEEAAQAIRDAVARFAQRVAAIRALALRGWQFDVVIAPAPEAPYLVISEGVVHDLGKIGVPVAIELWSHDRYDSQQESR